MSHCVNTINNKCEHIAKAMLPIGGALLGLVLTAPVAFLSIGLMFSS